MSVDLMSLYQRIDDLKRQLARLDQLVELKRDYAARVWVATLPWLNIVSQGETEEEAIEAVKEAARMHMDALRRRNEVRVDALCLGCRHIQAAKKGGGIVRDCLAYCSNCRAKILSIDYVHTCRGGRLCPKCWTTAGGPVSK